MLGTKPTAIRMHQDRAAPTCVVPKPLSPVWSPEGGFGPLSPPKRPLMGSDGGLGARIGHRASAFIPHATPVGAGFAQKGLQTRERYQFYVFQAVSAPTGPGSCFTPPDLCQNDRSQVVAPGGHAVKSVSVKNGAHVSARSGLKWQFWAENCIPGIRTRPISRRWRRQGAILSNRYHQKLRDTIPPSIPICPHWPVTCSQP